MRTTVQVPCLSFRLYTVLQLEIALPGVALRFPDAIGTPTMELGLYDLCYIQGDNDGSFPAQSEISEKLLSSLYAACDVFFNVSSGVEHC